MSKEAQKKGQRANERNSHFQLFEQDILRNRYSPRRSMVTALEALTSLFGPFTATYQSKDHLHIAFMSLRALGSPGEEKEGGGKEEPISTV